MNKTHPLYYQLTSICDKHDLPQEKAALAFQQYVEMCEVKKLWEVKCNFEERLKVFYLTAKSTENDNDYNIYIPVTSDEFLKVDFVEVLQRNISQQKKSNGDSSSTYYRFTSGLVKPDSPSIARQKKAEEKKNKQFQRQIIKWKKKLFVKAINKKLLSKV